jgi:hypothetical protein
MYRDDPLDDEMELRELLGDDPVDALVDADAVIPALDVLRILQGWVEDPAAAGWFLAGQRRLDDRTPVQALADGDDDLVLDAARRWAAAQG